MNRGEIINDIAWDIEDRFFNTTANFIKGAESVLAPKDAKFLIGLSDYEKRMLFKAILQQLLSEI